MDAKYQLVIRSGPTLGKVFKLDQPSMVIGRDTKAEISILDGEISRRHARLTLHADKYYIEDLGSTNGSKVNGQPLYAPHLLRPGDVISLGDSLTLAFEMPQGDIYATADLLGLTPPESPDTEPQPAPLPEPPVQNPVETPKPATPVELDDQKKVSTWVVVLIIIVLLVLLICACGVGIVLLLPRLGLNILPAWLSFL